MKFKLILLFFIVPTLVFSQTNFNQYFSDHSLRFDYLLGGNKTDEKVFPVQMKQEPYWAGSKTNLVDWFNYGNYRFRVFDLKTDSLLFSKGFSSLFDEWQSTAEAKKIEKTFYQSAIFPFPKQKIRLEIDARQRDGQFTNIYVTEIDPESYFILNEPPAKYETTEIVKNGKPENKVDIVILAEGYTSAEMEKFIPRIHKANTPPIAAIGTAEKISKACFTE